MIAVAQIFFFSLWRPFFVKSNSDQEVERNNKAESVTSSSE